MGDMFQCKINKIFNDMLNVFGIADDILVVGYNKDGTIIVLAERYLSLQTTNRLYQCSKKDIATLLQCIQHILLKIHQYRAQIIYKSGPKIFTADWLSRHHHVEGKDKPPGCISISEICQASAQENNIQHLKNFIIAGWPNTKDELHIDLKPY